MASQLGFTVMLIYLHREGFKAMMNYIMKKPIGFFSIFTRAFCWHAIFIGLITLIWRF